MSDQAGSLYELDEELLASLSPDLILTQEQCDVCAVNEATVRRAASALAGQPDGRERQPDDAWRDLRDVPPDRHTCWTPTTSAELLRRALRRDHPRDRQPPERNVSDRPASGPSAYSCSSGSTRRFRPGTGTRRSLSGREGSKRSAVAGQKSRRVTWDEVASSEPDLIIVAPCGFSLERTVAELAAFKRSCPHGAIWPRFATVASWSSTGRLISRGPAHDSRPACASPPRPLTPSGASTWPRPKVRAGDSGRRLIPWRLTRPSSRSTPGTSFRKSNRPGRSARPGRSFMISQ